VFELLQADPEICDQKGGHRCQWQALPRQQGLAVGL